MKKYYTKMSVTTDKTHLQRSRTVRMTAHSTIMK